jgi:hypothetical protein
VRHDQTFGLRGYLGGDYPRDAKGAARSDAWPPSGLPAGSDLAFLREQLLDAWGIEYGILNNLLPVAEQRNPEWGAALAHALNDWQVGEWLDPEPRLRASIAVPYETPELSIAEIEQRARDNRFVQVLMLARTREPLGRRKYWPIFEVAEELDLPIGIHFGGAGGPPITAAGFPSFYIEDHAGMSTAFQDQLTSLIFEGVFERFPGLKVVLIEAGLAWMLPCIWRLDRSWLLLREEIPAVKRPPSDYVRNHIWITTQPIEEPTRGTDLLDVLAELDMNDRIMFSTDYPHWDFDAPDRVFPPRMSQELKQSFFCDNARALYKLGP